MTRTVLALTIALLVPACTIYLGSDDDDHPPWQPEADAGWLPSDASYWPDGAWPDTDAGWYPDAGYYPDAEPLPDGGSHPDAGCETP